MSIIFDQSFLMRSCAMASVVVASILIVIKSFLLHQTNSFGVEASLLDSILDIVASIINYFAIRQALKPPSKEYRFGYSKAEALAGLAQSALIILSALWLIQDRLIVFEHKESLCITTSAFYWMIAISCLTLVLILWQRFVLKRVNSIAVQADSMHFETDIYMDLGLMLNFLSVKLLGLESIDLIFGISALIFVLYKTYPILKQSFDILMDKELSTDIRERIIGIVMENKNVLNIHQLRTRSLGQRMMFQFHIVLDSSLTLLKAHDITDKVENNILKAFPDAYIIIHQDCYQDDEDVF
ncbi:MAG: cation diffusion facilitator family transporter [Proteobacteria bacterium]|nr:cation diffusion facilitator family transporter [Pseudomonadota bacterium]